MANRSDFSEATLPKSIKRMLRLSSDLQTDSHQYGVVKRLFIEAHARHKVFKSKKQYFDTDEVTVDEVGGIETLTVKEEKIKETQEIQSR